MISNAKIRINLKEAKKMQKKRWQNLEKTGRYGYLRVFSINKAHGLSQLSQGKVRGLHTNIPLTQDKSKWVWHFDTLTPYSLNHIKKLSARMKRIEAKVQWGKLWRACAVCGLHYLFLFFITITSHITVCEFNFQLILYTFKIGKPS